MIPEGTPGAEIAIVIVAVTTIACLLLFALFRLTRPGTESPTENESPRPASAPIGSPRPHSRPSLLDVVMSRLYAWSTQNEGSTSHLANQPGKDLQPIATPSKPANRTLAGQGLDDQAVNDLSDITPAEVREIIRQQARAEAIVSILKATENGKVKSTGDQAGLIEAVSGASRTSRTGSPYTALKNIVDDLRGKNGPRYQQLDENHRPIGIRGEP